jgi:hypothetical protein
MLQGKMPLHDVTRERRRDPPRNIAMRSEQKQPARVDRGRNKKRRPVVPLEPRFRSRITDIGDYQAACGAIRANGSGIANAVIVLNEA